MFAQILSISQTEQSLPHADQDCSSPSIVRPAANICSGSAAMEQTQSLSAVPVTQPPCLSLGRSTPWPCSCGRAGTTTVCPTTTPTRRWGWTVGSWTSCGCPTHSSSTPNLLGSTMSPWRTSWSVCSPTESFYTAAGTSKQITVVPRQLNRHRLLISFFFFAKLVHLFFSLLAVLL